MLVRVQESIFDEHDKYLSEWDEIFRLEFEEASVEGCHDVIEKDFHIFGLIKDYLFNEFGKLAKWEHPNINRFSSQSIQCLLYKHRTMSFIFKDLNHIDQNFGVDRVQFVL